jgi:ABC-type transport system involved in multi-copper enzyme maturation permease subunit
MLKTLLLKELLEILKTTKFLVAFAAYVILIPLALYTGQQHYESRLASFQQAQTVYERSLEGTKNALDVEPQALYQPSRLMILSRDMAPYFPAAFTISSERGVSIGSANVPPSLFEKIFGNFDLLFIVTVIVSLLSVLVIYDTVSGEKERGTLALLLSYPAPRSKLFLAKYLGPLIASALCIAIGFLAGLLLLLGLTQFVLDGEMATAVLAAYGISVLYCSVALLLGLAASTFTHKSTNSLLGAVLLWMVFVLVVPRLGMLAAESLVPVESPETLSLKEELARKDIDKRQNAELGKIFSAPDYETLRQPIASRYKEELTSTLRDLEESHVRRQQHQEQLALLLGGISPATQLTRAMTEITATGYASLRQLLRDVRLYSGTIAKDIYSRGFRDQIPDVGVKMVFDPVQLSELPRFSQTTPALSERLATSVGPIVALLLFNVVLFSLAVIRGLRYDAR